MRFVSDGPNIPSELIEQRDLGNVIFFCGAGISIPAGLPSFPGLTETIISKLGATKAVESLKAGDSLDRVFGLLVREFGRPEIDRQIHKLLKTPSKPDVSRHKAILELSMGGNGRRKVVTTNFDLLFERAAPGIAKSVPPLLPDLSLSLPLQGVIYLHGRLGNAPAGVHSNYVISSTDFGRAYLTQGWAARFVKSLRENYTIVLLGYRADDPPMRYLLEGLNAEGTIPYDYPIYAFTQGDEGQAEEEWFDRGVVPICYSGPSHDKLWESLDAWAFSVRNPDLWVQHVTGHLKHSPRQLLPFERGQVAQFVSTKAGAKHLRETADVSAEWMCVFDPNTRYLQPLSSWTKDAETDPFDLYGLDDDPPRVVQAATEPPVLLGANFLAPLRSEPRGDGRSGLVGWTALSSNAVGERLEEIARWFASVADQPAAIWWAAGWKSLSPTMRWHLNRRLTDKAHPLPSHAQKFWQLYLGDAAPEDALVHDSRWFEFRELVSQHGWSATAIRRLRAILVPYVAFERNNASGLIPDERDWTNLELRQVVEASVKVLDRHDLNLMPPDLQLREVVECYRDSLLQTAKLLGEVETRWWRAPSLLPDEDHASSYRSRKDAALFTFRDLFDHFVRVDPVGARLEMCFWPKDDKYFFGMLHLYALATNLLLEAEEFVSEFETISSNVFWGAEYQRELLWAFRKRWATLSAKQRSRLEDRILLGPDRWEDESDDDFLRRKATTIASRLTWLQLNNCKIGATAKKALEGLKKIDPRWRDEWAAEADESLSPHGGTIERVTELRGIDLLPVPEIVSSAEAKTEDRFSELRDYRPFAGLVQQYPAKALASLRFELRRGNFPQRFWENLLSDWPRETSQRLRWLMLNTLANLAPDRALALRYYIPRWVEGQLKDLARGRRSDALQLFDKILSPYKSAAPELTESGIGDTTVGGVVQERSQVSIDKAINSPIGILTSALWTLMPKHGTSKTRMSSSLDRRFQALLSAPGDGGGHAACVIATHTRWLANWFQDWFDRTMLPTFQPDHPLAEGTWHGWSMGDPWLRADRLEGLKWAFADVLSGNVIWKLEENARKSLTHWFVYYCRKQDNRPPLYTHSEARAILMALNDEGRGDALWALGNVLEDVGQWRSFVKPFIENAWPRHVRFRTEDIARSFARLLEHTGAHFPEATKLVLPFLRPVAHLDMLTYRMAREGNEAPSLAEKYPAECLKILAAMVPEDRWRRPYELPEVLQVIAEVKPELRRTPEFRRLSELAG